MNKILIAFIVLLSYQSQAQNFTIPIKDHPYFRIIEWKGKGGLLMSRNPKEFMNQINLSLIGEKEEGMWDQKFNPKVREPFYLFNENTRHVYFLNNLDLVDNGRATFNQINSAGNVKSKVLDVGLKVKALKKGYEYNKFNLINATVTEKALIYHYRYHDKKEKEYREFAVFMTHHNLQHNIVELGYVDVKDVQNGKSGQWVFAGFEGEVNYFSWGEMKADVRGWTIKGFSPKGEVVEDHFLKEPDYVRPFKNIGYGNTGKYYTNDDDLNDTERGIVSYIDGHFYATSIQDRANGSELVLQKQIGEDGDVWEELNSIPLEAFNPKEDIELGTFPIKEGITYHYRHDGIDKVGILHFEKNHIGLQEDFTEQSVFNPSRFLIDHSENEFVTKAVNKVVVCDLEQFKRSGGVSFQHR